MPEEPAIQSINQHTQKTTLDWLFNILIQPSSGTGSGVSPNTHEQYGLSLDLIRQALVEIDAVVNNVTTAVPGYVLDARQGKVLADQITAIINSKAVANGIATLGSDGKIPSAQIPSLALVDVFTVASQEAMLALGAEQGDMAVRTDSSQVFILSASPASTLENWVELAALKALVDAHANRTDNPHGVSKEQVGLGSVDNTSDVDKPISTAQQNAINAKESITNVNALKGVDWTDETVKGNADAIETLSTDKVDKVVGKGLSTEDFTTTEKNKLAGIAEGAQVNSVTSVAGKAGAVTLVKGDVGLANVDNTSDANKPVSIAQQEVFTSHDGRITRLEGRAPKIYGFKKHKATGVITPLYDSVDLGSVPVINGSRPVDFVNPYKDINIFYWRSCLMNTKQQILAYHGQPGYDTPGVSDSYEVQIPRAYINVWEDDDYSYKIVSESQAMEGMFVPGCFRDSEGNEMPYAYVDKYRRGTVGGISVSRPDVLPDVSQTMLQFETKAEAIDDTMLWTGNPEELDWYITIISQIMALNIDTQDYYGQGMSSMPYSSSHTVVAVTTDANTVIVSNSTASAFKVSMNVKLGTALGNGQIFDDRTIQSITDNGDGTSIIVVDGDPFTTVIDYVLHAHRQVTTSHEADEIGEDCGFVLHDGRSGNQVENWFNGIAGNGGNVYEFSFGILRYDNQPYICHDRRELKHNDDPRLNPAYRPCGYVFEQTDGSYTYVKNMKLVGDKPYCIEWVSEGGAGSTTHYADPVYYLTADYRGTRIVLRRFYWTYGSFCGRVGLYGYYVLSASYWYIGWRSSPSLLRK